MTFRAAALLRLLLPLCAVLACAFALPALASEPLSDSNAKLQSLEVNSKGEALVTYRRRDGKVRRVLVWDAVNSAAPATRRARQVRFKYDYAGGWGKYHKASYWSTFKNPAPRTTVPPLVYFVAGCKAPDGTYWAHPVVATTPAAARLRSLAARATAYELHLSHWNGELAKIEVYTHWTYGGQWQGVFGRFTYLGQPIFGFGSTAEGNPNDRYGGTSTSTRFNSAYGPGWKRESGILVHKPNGTFCHSFVPQKPFPGVPEPGDATGGTW